MEKVILCLLICCACTASAPIVEKFSPVKILEADPDLARRASGAISALKHCEGQLTSTQATIQELRAKLEECAAKRIDVERDAGKYDGLRYAVAGIVGTILSGLIAVLGIKARKFFGSPI